MDIVEFLRARLDEDEAVAQAALTDPWRVESDWTGVSDDWTLTTSETRTVFVCNHEDVSRGVHDDGRGIGVAPPAEVKHIARHDPARVLREVEAKRRIVDRAEEAGREFDRQCAAGIHSAAAREATAAWVPIQNAVADLASVYADHPDYDPEWA